MVNCFWAPTSRHVMTISKFNIRMTVWSMIDKSIQYIESPKHSGNDPTAKGVAFSPNDKVMAVIQKNLEDGKDLIGLYDLTESIPGTKNWRCLYQFYPETFDA